jgi:DNA-binding transcriptional ArsR family regulator/uncharacterized protein YndB with AHSA1/START domain
MPSDPFRALADPTRRALLDRLRERNGQSLGELVADLPMARQSATQHLQVLEDANLVTVVRRGRERLHYLNPVPIREMQERWISRFDAPRLDQLGQIKRRAEMNQRPAYVYVTYIAATPEAVWDVLTSAEHTAGFWGHSNLSDWKPGSRWEHVRTDGSGIADAAGIVVEADRPRKLAMTFGEGAPAPLVTFTIEPHHDIVKLTIVHEHLPSDEDLEAVSLGWPSVAANLKTLLETGDVLPQAPWEMHAGTRDAQLQE